MSAFNTVIGTLASTFLGYLVVQAIPEVGSPITVQELSYADGMVTLERTLNTDEPFFFMQKSGYIVDDTTNESLDICYGVKTQRFKPGRMKATVSLQRWSGNPACVPEAIPPGTYVPVAIYAWGDKTYTFSGPKFVIPATRQSGK